MTLPDPLTPTDCDLRGLEYMPLLGVQLFGSDFNATATDSEWRAAVTLWWAAWQQVPAASLPDDDAALCRAADLGRDLKTWRKLRAGALHGWVKCADGRLYNATLAKQALIAWDKRVKERERKAAWRAKKTGQEQSTDAGVPRDSIGVSHGTGHGQNAGVPADVTRRDETGRDDSIEEDVAERVREPAALPAVADFPTDLIGITDEICRAAGVRHVDPGRIIENQRLVREWIDEGMDPAEHILPAIRQALADNTETIHALKWFAQRIRQYRARMEANANGHRRQQSYPQRGVQPSAAVALRRRAQAELDALGPSEDDAGDLGSWAALPPREQQG